VDAVAASIGNIVAGQVSQAANYIESTLARSLSVAISFLARILGLGNLGQKVREIIGRVRPRVDVAVNTALPDVMRYNRID
jgi:sorbitol-specific phosphotransferase system component IIBC